MIPAGRVYITYTNTTNPIHIYDLSDFHLFNKGCCRHMLDEDIREIAEDDNAFVVGGGDYADYIGMDDPRFDARMLPATMPARDLADLGTIQTHTVRDVLEPLRGKIIGLLYGNHEYKYYRFKEQSQLHNWLCTELDTTSLSYSAFLDVVFVRVPRLKKPRLYRELPSKYHGKHTRWTVRFFVHHGAGYARTAGGKINKLVKFMDRFEADVYMVGHVHDKKGTRIAMLTADEHCTRVVQREKVGVIAGGYLKAYADGPPGYGEIKGYQPSILGCTRVSLWPHKHKIRGET